MPQLRPPAADSQHIEPPVRTGATGRNATTLSPETRSGSTPDEVSGTIVLTLQNVAHAVEEFASESRPHSIASTTPLASTARVRSGRDSSRLRSTLDADDPLAAFASEGTAVPRSPSAPWRNPPLNEPAAPIVDPQARRRELPRREAAVYSGVADSKAVAVHTPPRGRAIAVGVAIFLACVATVVVLRQLRTTVSSGTPIASAALLSYETPPARVDSAPGQLPPSSALTGSPLSGDAFVSPTQPPLSLPLVATQTAPPAADTSGTAPAAIAVANGALPVRSETAVPVTPGSAIVDPLAPALTNPGLPSPAGALSPLGAVPIASESARATGEPSPVTTLSEETLRESVVTPAAPAPAALRVPDRSAARAEEVSAAAETRAIETVLNRYRGAFDERNAEAASAVWPTADVRGLGRAFDQLEQQRLVFNECGIAVNETQATAECRGSATYVPRVGSKTPRLIPRVWRFDLRKRDTQWVIGNVTTQ